MSLSSHISGHFDLSAEDPYIDRILGGKFRVRSRLAQGAMGVVYRARHITLDVQMAIKVMHGELAADANFSRRFVQEAKIASSFVHPNAVRVVDCGREKDGTLYLAMELIKGRNLAAILEQEGRFSPARAASLIRQVLGALGAAHALGVVHRDVKPENIMVLADVDDNGDACDLAKVCDFGIASIAQSSAAESARITLVGVVIGTPTYMSPEQARGVTVDLRSDLYSVGVVLYELLTGAVPFDADSALALALKHVTDAVPPPEQKFPGVHASLAAVAMKAMAKNPADRYQSAREMRAAIHAAMSEGDAPQSIAMSRSVATIRPLLTPAEVRLSTQPTLVHRPEAQTVAPVASNLQTVTSMARVRRRGVRSSVVAVAALAALAGLALPQVVMGRVNLHAPVALRALGAQAHTAAVDVSSAHVSTFAAASDADRDLLRGGQVGLVSVAEDREDQAAASPVIALRHVQAEAEKEKGSPASARLAPAVEALDEQTRFERAVDANPSDSEALSGLGFLARTAGDAKIAKMYFERAVGANPHYLPAQLALADGAWTAGNRPEATQRYTQIVSSFAPSTVPARAVERSGTTL